MREQRFTVRDGYVIEEKRKLLYIGDAVTLLMGRGQHRVTTARKFHDDMAVLTGHLITCPHCRHSVPAYERFLSEIFHTYDPFRRKYPTDMIESWGSTQLCLWSHLYDTLKINTVYSPRGDYCCPYCDQESSDLPGSTEVTIREHRKKVTVTCTCADLGDFLQIPWNIKATRNVAFPFLESVTFNFSNGKTYITASDLNGNRLATLNINAPRDWKRSKVYQLLQMNSLVRRKVAQCFKRQWKLDFPFTQRELTPELFVMLTAYGGYPPEFYSRIPVFEDEYRVEKSFRGISRRIRTGKQLCSETARYGLPKSLRRTIYAAPDLGFYLPEIARLSNYISDINILRTALSCRFTYPLLSFLHMYPSVNFGIFFTDFIRFKGARALLNHLDSNHHKVLFYALHYSTLLSSARSAERRKWTMNKEVTYSAPVPTYALPMRRVSIPDSRLDGYEFHQLRSQAEYIRAGMYLQNCLGNWSETGNPVFVIRRKDTLLGAIEVDRKKEILQARGISNGPLPSECRSAFKKWVDRFNLSTGC